MAQSVSASIRYLKPEWRDRTELPRIGSRETRRANTEFYDVDIVDARSLGAELDLDTTGFLLTSHPTRVADFRNDAEVRATYYPEVKGLLRKLTGADEVAVLHHVLRTEDTGSFNSAYARYVHCDYSEARIRDMSLGLMVDRGICTRDEADRYDVAWYNSWQPIEREVQRNPLTLIDGRTLDPRDVVEYAFGEKESDYGVASAPLYSAEHRHYYFPRMQTDELILIKQFDTRPGRTRLCPHTSFEDPTAPDDALRRRSIEVRMMCMFERERS
jgi:hypothetical protein